MKKIKIFKSNRDLVRISCSCGYISFADNAIDGDYLAWVHSKKHKRSSIETYVEGVLQKDKRQAMPRRFNNSKEGVM